jgi:thioredoxin 2
MAGKAIVMKVDTEKNPRLAQRFGVRGIPHFVVLKGGQPVFEQSGLVPSREMQRWLANA